MPLHICCAPNCKNTKKKGFLMSEFPRNRKLFKEWILSINREQWTPMFDSVICDVHFSPKMWITKPDGERTLKKDAIPTVFPLPPVFEESDLSDTVTVLSFKSGNSSDELVENTPESIENVKKKQKVSDDSGSMDKEKEDNGDSQLLENQPSCSFMDKKEDLEKTDSKIQGGEKVFLCSVCNYECEIESVYDLHVKVHTWENQLSCPDPLCYFVCSEPSQLVLHAKTHTAE